MHFVLPLIVVGTFGGVPTFDNTIYVVSENSDEKQYKELINYYDDEFPTYDEIRFEAIYNCKHAKPDRVDEDLIDDLIDIEKMFGVPPALRGMILAAACLESGYNPSAKGDRKFSKNKRTPKAIGILQMWPVYEKAYGVDRYDHESAAIGWMKHITKQLPKVRKRCKFRTEKRNWIAAWVTGIRFRKPGGRCNERPKHYKLLKKWHKTIINNRMSDDEDGC